MINKHIVNLFALDYAKRLLIFDLTGFSDNCDYTVLLKENEFIIYYYKNVEEFRITYEEQIKDCESNIAIIVKEKIYVPYDIKKSFRNVDLSLSKVFPKLNEGVLTDYIRDLGLIGYAYDSCYTDNSTPTLTQSFLNENVFKESVVSDYCQVKANSLSEQCLTAHRYTDWIDIAKEVAEVKYYIAKYDVPIDLSSIDDEFGSYINDNYNKLSSEINRDFPPIITKTLDIVCGESNEKTVLIIMDGMSLFDFEIISRRFCGIKYNYDCSFAMIPTTTSISRQSLLSGKYPGELDKPFSVSNEEKEFFAAAELRGYALNQIMYSREHEPDISVFTKFIAIIINDIDEIVHGQKQGRAGMYNDMELLGKTGKLQNLVKQLYNEGYNVYITSDHGNTPCVGVGGFRSGVEIETRSARMAVMKDFAEKNELLEQNTTKYPGYYLDKSYQYYTCNPGVSFDAKNKQVMTHGGISLDEVIIPFIKITGVN